MNSSAPSLCFVLLVLLVQGLILLPRTDAAAQYDRRCMNVTLSSSNNITNSDTITGANAAVVEEEMTICADYYESTWTYSLSGGKNNESPYFYEYSFINREPYDYDDYYQESNEFVNNTNTSLDYDILYGSLPEMWVEIPYSRTGPCTITMDGKKCRQCSICGTNIRNGASIGYMDASIAVDCTNIIIGSTQMTVKTTDSCTPMQPLYFPFIFDDLLSLLTTAPETPFFQLKTIGKNGGCIGIDEGGIETKNKVENGVCLMLVGCNDGSNNGGRGISNQSRSLWSYDSKTGLVRSKIDDRYCWTIRGIGNGSGKLYLYKCINSDNDKVPSSLRSKQLSQQFFLDYSSNQYSNNQVVIQFSSSNNDDCVVYQGINANVGSDTIVIKKCDSIQGDTRLQWEQIVDV